MRFIDPDKWVPADGMDLEKAARDVIHARGNTLVIAGPGSGKTELLAQKASYLLQTNQCPWPKKILAISFKVDAAHNLNNRVSMRAGPKLARRFESMTFDKFAKTMFDRLRRALPANFNVAAYDINLRMASNIENAFRAVDERFYRTASVGRYEPFLLSRQIPVEPADKEEYVLHETWRYLLRGKKPGLNFGMVMRLATLIVQSNPKIKALLQQTYSHVFIDEFQDTTHIQYDFFKSCFLDGSVNFTAVGDDKQTIMGWAGAKPEIFDVYCKETHATPMHLVMNWRSAPKLIRFQNYLVEKLLIKPAVAKPSPKWNDEGGEVRMCYFPNTSREREYLVNEITHWLQVDGLLPRDICVLVKQLPENYTSELIALLAARGIRARDETKLQDLLSEPYMLYLIAALDVIFSEKAVKSWDTVLSFLSQVNQSWEDEKLLKMRKNCVRFMQLIKTKYNVTKATIDENNLQAIISEIETFTCPGKVVNVYPQYRDESWCNSLVEALVVELMKKSTAPGTMPLAIETLRGEQTIPIMTTHKSKGLEFHTVVFVGLEDSAFWNYANDPTPDNNTFFVALSRAKERAIFTFCQLRELRKGGGAQSTENIEPIHQLFADFEEINLVNEIP